MYTGPKLIELLELQQQARGKADLFKKGTFILQGRTKVGSFPSPDGETLISAGEPCGAWRAERDCPKDKNRPEDKRKLEDNWNYFYELPFNGYIPASSIRGIVRDWAKKRPHIKLRMEQLLGYQKDDKIVAGKIEFLDAYPEEPTRLTLDIVNPQEKFQVFHDENEQGKPLSFYTLGDGEETIPVTIAIRGIPGCATSKEVEEVWEWVEQALSLYGIGSRTASGYGRIKAATQPKLVIEPGYAVKTFDFILYSQGCYGAGGQKEKDLELRPSHWRGWLRSWVLRFLLGVMSEKDAKITLGKLFGILESENEQESYRGKVRLQMIKGETWGQASDDDPKFYTWKGKLELIAPQEILYKILLPIIKFAVSVGGVGRGWRRPLHIFMMKRNNLQDKPAPRGSHLILNHKVKSKKTNQIELVSWHLSPKKPETWQQTYDTWLEAVEAIWSDRINRTVNNQLAAEVFSPDTCAVYTVPGAVIEPIDQNALNWKLTTEPLDTRGDGLNLIYQFPYKREKDVGGNAAQGEGRRSHCSWVSIRRVDIPHLEENTDTQEIVCLFLGGENELRSKFLKDLAKLPGAVHLFGRQLN
jgi:CRISPR-associated protein Cmr6